MTDALVIGAGPAGLMAAEQLATAGLSVVVADAMPSVGRKFLMAGKSGLNLTKSEPDDAFRAAFAPAHPTLTNAITTFGPQQVIDWATGLGQPVFTGSTGRVFPDAMKASPLLRAWIGRLTAFGVTLRTRWHWTGWDGADAHFTTPDRPVSIAAKTTVLALGGASWARLGANGKWAALFADVAPFAPANMGFAISWSPHMARHFGAPLKGIGLVVNGAMTRGECVISTKGIEGGGIYAVSRALRDGATLAMDLRPDWSLDQVRTALSRPKGKSSLSNHLRKSLRLTPVQIALLAEFARPYPHDLAPVIKSLPIPLNDPLPMDQAISTAGGLRFSALDDDLMLRDRPGVFCAGEMLDWEAPTGGYLITACLATGHMAGRAAARYAVSF